MERFEINYSNKNIPIPSKYNYKIMLVSKIEKVINRMRWKTLVFLGKLDNDNNRETFGFKSTKCPPAVPELSQFENDLMYLVKNIEFRKVNNEFQNKLNNDINEIKNSTKVFVAADKSRHIYKMEKEQYQKLLKENITKTYKKSTKSKISNINWEAKKITEKLSLDDRVPRLQETEAYITVKDHKDDFPNKIPCRLINPSKSSIGKISKTILDRINKNVVTSIQINQWKNTSSVIEWFKKINNKDKSSFIQFDIESFYPSISENLFIKAIDFAKSKTPISDDELHIIMQSRKTLLFHEEEPWVKKEGNEDFDVPMGCYDGAEVCEATGSYILSRLSHIIDKELCGLHRDDGLASVENLSGPEIERLKKKIVKVFKDCGLNITIQANLRIVNFLDVQFDMIKGTYQPYRKPDNTPVYINKDSNHPPSIIKQLPKAIEKRISDISSNEEIFYSAIPTYTEALKRSGFNETLSFQKPDVPTNNTNQKKKRKRKIIWFNPPYSMNVKTNIGKSFLQLIRKHFPKHNNLHKIFNKNTVKVSYSCMGNISTIISSHNHKVLRPPNTEPYGCNCRSKPNCPLQNKCLTPKVIYQANVTNNVNTDEKFYRGLTETSFKVRFGNHTKDFNHKKYIKSTELSKYIWLLQDNNITPQFTWEMIAQVYANTRINFCVLCLTEKLKIIDVFDDPRLLNKKSELVNTCRHQLKLLLKSFKRNSRNNDSMD